jgi:hypothetical protein
MSDGNDAVEAVWSRQQRREAADKREAEAMGKVRSAGRKALKRLSRYEREKPTPERAAQGVYELVDATKFDTSRKREVVLVDLKQRAGGAGEMHTRGQIGERELRAAAMICELYERSQTSQLSGFMWSERVDGGLPDIFGNRLMAAANAAGGYRGALSCLSATSRFLVEHRVVLCLSMEDVVRMAGAERLGTGEKDMRRRCDRGVTLVKDALDLLADHLGLSS